MQEELTTMPDLGKFKTRVGNRKDPELPYTFTQLGMFRDAKEEGSTVVVTFAFTSDSCPFRSEIESMFQVEAQLAGFGAYRLETVKWDIGMVEEDLKHELAGAAAHRNLTWISNAIS